MQQSDIIINLQNKDNKIFTIPIKSSEKYDTISPTDNKNDGLKIINTNENPFPVEIYPQAIQDIIHEINSKYLFPKDFIGSCILSAVSASIGQSFKVEFKHGWVEKLNLYMVIVGQPGDAKTQALKFCFNPINLKESEYFAEYENDMVAFEKAMSDSSENKKNLKKPILRKILIIDFTPEALILNLNNNKRGLCVFVDELNGWIKNFNRYSNSGESETYLTLWSGGQISIDRASGKSLRLDDPCLSVVGSTQIGVLKDFAKDNRSENGFMDRLLFVYPTEQKVLKWNDESINKTVYENYTTFIHKLIELGTNNNTNSKVIPIESEAKRYLLEWQNNRPVNFFFAYERSIEIKLQQYLIRFSGLLQLIFSIIDGTTRNQVELYAVKGAIKLFDYFYYNATRVRGEIFKKNYLETLTDLQKSILNEMPLAFSTAEGLRIACRIIEGRARISERQFKTYLSDGKLFKKIAHGQYEKLLL